MAPGAEGNQPALGTPTPLSAPCPRQESVIQSPGGPAVPVGRGLWKKENSRVCPGAGKTLVSTPFPRRSAQTDSSGRGAGRACALGFVLRTRPEGGGEGAGLPPPHRPPTAALRPDSMLAAPCLRRCALPPLEARLTLGLPEGPGAHKLSSGPRPHAPRFLGLPGSDRCLRDRLSFVPKERGTRAGSPAPSRSRCPHPQLSFSAALSPVRPRRGRGELPAVSNVHFLNQTNPPPPPPRAHPSSGQGRLSPEVGSEGVGPSKGPPTSFLPGGRAASHQPPLAHRGRDSKHRSSHTHNRMSRTTPPPPPSEKKKLSKLSARLRAHLSHSCAPH